MENTPKKTEKKPKMTDEEKRQKKADYMREYMRNKYKNDPKFREQHIKRCVENNNENLKEKYHNDPDYKKQLLEKQKIYREKFSSYDLLRKKTISKLKNNIAYRNAIKEDTLKKYNIQPSDYMA